MGINTYNPADAQKVGEAILGFVNKAKNSAPNSLDRAENTSQALRLRREAAVMKALGSESGMKKLAQNLKEPVKTKLDYKSIGRQFVVTENMTPGEPAIYDKDFPAANAVVVGKKGTAAIVEGEGERVTLYPFNIVARYKVPFDELTDRRFKAIVRARERITEGMALREDLRIFALIAANAATGGTTPVSVANRLTKRALALSVGELRANRVPVANYLWSVSAMTDLMTFDRDDFTPAKMDEMLDTGFLGTLWGVPIHMSDQITAGTGYTLGDPQLTMWMPIYQDVEVLIADDQDNLLLGFVAWERLAMTHHNSLGVCSVSFNASAA